ncbi:MAG: hypothetical protein AB7L09_02440 [Nitrospira sp.]
MTRHTHLVSINKTLYIAFSDGESVPTDHDVLINRHPPGTKSTRLYMNEEEARQLMLILMERFPLDALGGT